MIADPIWAQKMCNYPHISLTTFIRFTEEKDEERK